MAAPSLTPVAAVMISKKRRALLDALRRAGATSAARAVPLARAGLEPSVLLEIQKLRGVVVDAGGERFYLDEAAEAQAAAGRKMVAAVLIAAIVVMLILSFARG